MFHYLKDNPKDDFVTKKKIIQIVQPGKNKQEILNIIARITKKKNIPLEDFIKIIQEIIDFFIISYERKFDRAKSSTNNNKLRQIDSVDTVSVDN